MRKWLSETHGPGLELLRHFLLRFFDSDLVTNPGQRSGALIGGFSVLLPWFPVIVGPLKEKYKYFSKLAEPRPYRMAVRADELWLITLMMASIGLLTAIKWQSLFPGLRDYRALGALPLKSRQIFASKLMALLLVTTAAVAVLNAFPALLFPAVSGGRWALNPSIGGRIWAHAVSCVAASYFFFFALVAIQGVLLNLLPPRRFGQVAGYLQGFLVAAMLTLIVLSFSIQAQFASAVLRPEIAAWLPPAWFVGLYQTMLGDRDPAMQALAEWAVVGLSVGVVLALLTHLASYKRHRVLMVEGGKKGAVAGGTRGVLRLIEWLVPNPRERAVTVFMAQTLMGSSQHRTILMGYGGFGLAILLSGMIGVTDLVRPDQIYTAFFIYAHVILLVFLLLGFRQLFAIPVELKANWMFQITEREGRQDWLRARDRLVLAWSVLVMFIMPFPLEVALLGWRAPAEQVLVAAFGAVCYGSIFASWDKLPFTCSYLPGKTPPLRLALCLLGFLTALPVVNGLLLYGLYHPMVYVVLLLLLIGAAARIQLMRAESHGETRLKYEDLPEPVIHGLNLSK